jgi:hypothetical protein
LQLLGMRLLPVRIQVKSMPFPNKAEEPETFLNRPE